MTEAQAAFARLLKLKNGGHPYPHQLQVFDCLQERKPVLLLAPTGAGKSEAAFVPFLAFRGSYLPHRLIYVLPMRTLVNSLAQRFKRLVETCSPELRVCSQHGERPESVLFYADAVVATLDQVVSSYACAPLSLGIRHGNIPAGAVISSFVIFDEVHTFDPQRGLQSALIIADRLHKMELPFVIMTATLPQSVMERLKERFAGMEIIIAHEEDIPSRRQRELVIELQDSQLTPEVILRLHSQRRGRTIVVCNTVQRALQIYGILNSQSPVKPILVHSRFTGKDRDTKEREVDSAFGKASEAKEAILIATQVIEVGLDISADLLLTELAPIDSLIQRMGRCARWLRPAEQNLEGKAVVFAVGSPAPYAQVLLDKTRDALEEVSGVRLSWDMERDLVEEVLGKYYARFLDITAASKAVAAISKAAFYGDRKSASDAVRDNDSVEVSVHSNPQELAENVWYLPRISLSRGTLSYFIEHIMPDLWRIETRVQGEEVKAAFEPMNTCVPILAGDFYVISSKYARYSVDTGLVLGETGEDMSPSLPPPKAMLPRDHQLETWEQHTISTMECFEEILLRKEGYILEPLGRWLNLSIDELMMMLKIALLGHDLGKLTEEWQRAAWSDFKEWAKESNNLEKLGEKGKEILEEKGAFLARFPSPEKSTKPRPAHATVSAYLLGPYLKQQWSDFGVATAMAIAHHHAVRAQQVPKYVMKSGWQGAVAAVFEKYGLYIPWENLCRYQPSATEFPYRMFDPVNREKAYTLYVVVARLVSLADRIAAGGGEDAILSYEKWAYGL